VKSQALPVIIAQLAAIWGLDQVYSIQGADSVIKSAEVVFVV
jgi:hypothetical protein